MNRSFRSAPAAILLYAFITVLFLGGCSNKSPVNNHPVPSTIDALNVIVNPLSPAPGDTAQLTAQTAGTSAGALPDFQWRVDAGTLLDTTGISVRWVVPSEKGIYHVFMRSTLGAAVDTMSRYIMVRDLAALNTGIRWSMFPSLVGAQVLFVGTNTNPISANPNFYGFQAYNFQGGNSALLTRDLAAPAKLVMGGQGFIFLRLTGVLASVVTDGSPFYRAQPMSILLFPYDDLPVAIALPRNVATVRWDQNTSPSASPDEQMYVWQNNKTGPKDDGTADECNIAFKVSGGGTLMLTDAVDSTFQFGAWTKHFFRNVRPIFSPDASKIVYFVDSTGTFEPCIINMGGQSPIRDSRHALMVDERHGIFNRAGVAIGEKTYDKVVFEWNPTVNNKLAFLDDNRSLCILDVAAENVQALTDVGKVQEFAWASDGRIAAITSGGVLIVNQSGTVDSVFVKEKESDLLVGVAWSSNPSDPKLAFRMIRKGKSTADSFSALVVYSLNSRQWYYATPRISWATEPIVPYTYMRAVFEADNNGVYFAAPNPAPSGGSQVTIFRSF